MNRTIEAVKPGKKNNPKSGEKGQRPETLGEAILSWVKTILGAILIVMVINGVLVASFVVPTGSMEDTVLTGDFLFVNKFIYGPSTPQIIPFVNIPLPYLRFPGIREPERGDVIVFVFPGNRNEIEPEEFQYYLKRCIATAGDTVALRNKEVYINGVKTEFPEHSKVDRYSGQNLSDPSSTFPPGRGFTRDNYGPLVVPKEGDVIKLSVDNFQEWRTFIAREGHEVGIKGSRIMIDGEPATEYIVERDYCFGLGDNRDHSLDSRYWGFIPYENVVGTPLIVYWSWNTNAASFFSKFSTIRFNRLFTVIE